MCPEAIALTRATDPLLAAALFMVAARIVFDCLGAVRREQSGKASLWPRWLPTVSTCIPASVSCRGLKGGPPSMSAARRARVHAGSAVATCRGLHPLSTGQRP